MAKSQGNRLRWVVWLAAVALFLDYAVGPWLVVDAPAKADVIVVLAGETQGRPARGLQLLDQDYASKMLLDVPAGSYVYEQSQLQIAQQFLSSRPEAAKLAACPIVALSTRDEAHDVAKCLTASLPSGVHSILLVTSDFHTRRALAIFRHEMPGVQFSIAASYDRVTYGPKWWQQREWAKTFSGECMRLLWWYGVDRWRG